MIWAAQLYIRRGTAGGVSQLFLKRAQMYHTIYSAKTSHHFHIDVEHLNRKHFDWDVARPHSLAHTKDKKIMWLKCQSVKSIRNIWLWVVIAPPGTYTVLLKIPIVEKSKVLFWKDPKNCKQSRLNGCIQIHQQNISHSRFFLHDIWRHSHFHVVISTYTHHLLRLQTRSEEGEGCDHYRYTDLEIINFIQLIAAQQHWSL